METLKHEPELIEIPSVMITESGEQFLQKEDLIKELLELRERYKKDTELLLKGSVVINENKKEIAQLQEDLSAANTELQRLRDESIQYSLAIQTTGDHARARASEVSVLKMFLITWLDEFEAKFERLKRADSNTIAEDYVKQAEWMAKTFGRHNHSIKEVQAWIDGDNLPY